MAGLFLAFGTPTPVEAAQEALTDMPPRGEQELDPVTLHNQVGCFERWGGNAQSTEGGFFLCFRH